MKLYFMPGACSLAPHIVAREVGLDLQLVRVTMGPEGKKTSDGKDFLSVTPKGYVPALVLDDGDVLTEASALVQYLADKKPDTGLMPHFGAKQRYHVTEWLAYISTEVHKGLGVMFKPDADKEKGTAAMLPKFAFLDNALKGKSYLLGEQFTVADVYLYVVLNWTKFLKIDLGGYPNVSGFMKRVGERPQVQAAIAAERAA